MGKYAIILILGLVFILGYVYVGMNSNQSMALEQSISSLEKNQAQNIANSHARVVLNELFKHDEHSGIINLNSSKYKYNMDLKDIPDASVSTRVEDRAINPKLMLGQYKVIVKGRVKDKFAETVIYYDRKAYSYYGLFLNDPGSGYYTDNEVINGPIFSNKNFNIGGKIGPNINDNLSVAGKLNIMGHLNKNNWLNNVYGNQFCGDQVNEGVGKIPFKNTQSWMSQSAENKGSIDSDWPNDGSNLHMVFLDNGDVAISRINIKPSDVRENAITNPNQTKIYTANQIASKGKVLSSKKHSFRVQGTISGQLTIATHKNVYYDNDVKYKNDPRLPGNENSKDLLAVMNKGTQYLATDPVWQYDKYGRRTRILPNPPPNGIEIMACMYTEKTIKPESRNPHYGFRGAWKTYGSRIQHSLSPTFAGSNSRWGFTEEIFYDERLREQKPPEMPWTNKRKVTSWVESLKVMKAS